MNTTETHELPVSLAANLEAEKVNERWLITDLWGHSAVGLIGGHPKCGKSFLGLDLAVSTASGTPCLGRFPVETSGPTLVYLAEDSIAQVRSRIEGLCEHRGLDIDRLPVHVITAVSLRLDTVGDQERLHATVDRIKPRLVLLDPLVRLHRLDENSSSDISGFLGYFRELQRTFDTAVVLVHHASKKSRSQPGQALRGSTDLHAFGDSNAYVARKGDQIILTVEHRAAKPPAPLTLDLVSEPDGSQAHLEVSGGIERTASPSSQPTLEQRVLATLNESPKTRSTLRAYLGVNNQRLGDVLCALEKDGRASRTDRGWVRDT